MTEVEWQRKHGPATVAAPWDKGFSCFRMNRAGGATMALPCNLGFPAYGVNRSAIDSAGLPDPEESVAGPYHGGAELKWSHRFIWGKAVLQ